MPILEFMQAVMVGGRRPNQRANLVISVSIMSCGADDYAVRVQVRIFHII